METIKIKCDICPMVIYLLGNTPDEDWIECPSCHSEIEVFENNTVEIIEVN